MWNALFRFMSNMRWKVASSVSATVCASGEAADQMRQHVDLSEVSDDRVGCLLGGGETVERRGKRSEVRVIEVGLLDLGREADHGETRVQQGFRDVGSEAAIGSGD